MSLSEIKAELKNFNQPFKFKSKKLEFNVGEFWAWNQSDLIENRNRGILAEFIVMKALGLESTTRLEWDAYDFETKEDVKIEVKSSAYIQSWEQKKLSSISFNIAPARKWEVGNKYSEEKTRWADIYIFCLLDEKDQNVINPMILDQWTFYIVSKKTLDEHNPLQKSIGLYYIDRIEHKKCKFDKLKARFDEVCLSVKKVKD